MQSTAQGWLVYELTRSPFYLGVVSAAASMPVLLFTLIGGVVADRFLRRNLLIVTQTLSMVPALAVAVLLNLGLITVWEIVVFAVMLGTINAFDVPARQSFLIEMVDKGRLMSAIAFNSAAFNGARIIGPFMAGITISSIGVAACFYVNAASFLAAIVALRMIRTRKDAAGARVVESGEGKETSRVSGLVRDLLEGLRFVRHEGNIFGIMRLVALFSLLGIPFIVMLPVFAADILKVGPGGLGIMAGSSGVGALAAALFIAFRGEIRRKGRFMVGAGLLFGISLLLFSFSANYLLSLVMLVLTGFGIVSFLAVGNSFIQLSVPDALRGRVMSVYSFVFLGIAPLGSALVGSVAHFAGTARAISMGSALCLAGVFFSSKRLKAIDEVLKNNS